MSPPVLESLFSLASLTAMAGWLLLVFVPRPRWSRTLAGVVLPLLLGLLYVWLVATQLPGARGGFGSLAEVAELFSQPAVLLAGWVHYLSFDLFIGAWETRDAQRRGVPHLLVIPCLFFTFMLGPVGLLLYFGLRTWKSLDLSLSDG